MSIRTRSRDAGPSRHVSRVTNLEDRQVGNESANMASVNLLRLADRMLAGVRGR
jgi:hypothetical protein